jgi:protoheme IX farnesyltransferase
LKSADSITGQKPVIITKLSDVAALFKLRLAAVVVLSSVLGYYMGTSTTNWTSMLMLCLGGFLLTGGSNGMNQVWERNLDALMDRTMNRPIPAGRMNATEASIFSIVAAILGVTVLWIFLNPLSGILGALAFFIYVFLYTPLKQVTPLAVFVGAFPGAIPPMLGYVAATNTFGIEPGCLFAMQFMWQFPHFWAIAWVAHDDYTKGGYRLLPFKSGRSSASAKQILLYSLILIPVSLLPWALPGEQQMIGNVAMTIATVAGLGFAWFAVRLYQEQTVENARKLMFASFLYLPLVQLAYVFDKV